MSTVAPPIQVITQLTTAGNQAITSLADPLAGTPALPETGQNNHFTQVLSQLVQNSNDSLPVPGFISDIQAATVEQVLPEQGSIMPLEGNLLPQNKLTVVDQGLEGLVNMLQPDAQHDMVLKPAQPYTADQDPLGLVTGLIKLQDGNSAINPLPSSPAALPLASVVPVTASTGRIATEPTVQAAGMSSLQQTQDSTMIDLGDAAMSQEGEPGRKDTFFQAMQESRLASLPQAVSETGNQTLAAGREAVAAVMNTASPAVIADVAGTAKPVSMPTLNLHEPLNRPEWRDEMASRVGWMVRNDQSAARLRINPAHLGPMEISIRVSQDQANVSFISQHMQVRDAVELAIPRLREMLEQQGLNLADVDISTGYSNAGHMASDSGDDADVGTNQQAHNGSGLSDAAGDDGLHAQAAEMELDLAKGLLDEYV